MEAEAEIRTLVMIGAQMLHQAEEEVVAEEDLMVEMTLETTGAQAHPWVVVEEEAEEASVEATMVEMTGDQELHQ